MTQSFNDLKATTLFLITALSLGEDEDFRMWVCDLRLSLLTADLSGNRSLVRSLSGAAYLSMETKGCLILIFSTNRISESMACRSLYHIVCVFWFQEGSVA